LCLWLHSEFGIAEVFPSYRHVAKNGTVDTFSGDVIVIDVADLPSASAKELASVDGNAGEFIRAVVKQGYRALQARPLADRPTKFSILQQQGTTDAGVNAETLEPEATHQFQIVTIYPVGSNGSAIAPEPTV
jgi:hypothetical protein